ncbi:hypothetical protein BO71DRAFT_393914, partial [Aspergillus ellipticus CBS 707.79]
MRWGPESDQLLLIKILETHSIAVDTKKVAAAWPVVENDTPPTPRAITERLVRIRQLVREAGGSNSNFSIGSGKNRSATSTPRKSPKSAASTPGSAKRKRGGVKKEDEGMEILSVKKESESDVAEVDETPTKKKKQSQLPKLAKQPILAGSTIQPRALFPMAPGQQSAAAADAMGKRSPTKRVRKASTRAPGMVNWNEAEELELPEAESSTSEYAPETEAGAEGLDMDDIKYC